MRQTQEQLPLQCITCSTIMLGSTGSIKKISMQAPVDLGKIIRAGITLVSLKTIKDLFFINSGSAENLWLNILPL